MRSAEVRVVPKVITVPAREQVAAAALRVWDPAGADLEVAAVVAAAVDSLRIYAVREVSRTTV